MIKLGQLSKPIQAIVTEIYYISNHWNFISNQWTQTITAHQFHFLKGKKIAMVKIWHFRVKARHFFSHLEVPKTYYALASLVWAFWLFWGFLFLKKNPPNSPQSKRTWLQQNKIGLRHDPEIYHFSIFLVQVWASKKSSVEKGYLRQIYVERGEKFWVFFFQQPRVPFWTFLIIFPLFRHTGLPKTAWNFATGLTRIPFDAFPRYLGVTLKISKWPETCQFSK